MSISKLMTFHLLVSMLALSANITVHACTHTVQNNSLKDVQLCGRVRRRKEETNTTQYAANKFASYPFYYNTHMCKGIPVLLPPLTNVTTEFPPPKLA